ncbi:MAG: family 1 glycosylhydrolase [Candidatus Omnitrophica bacterium]|nr:family 1 glycosylhydrolase [Candidatus Omnitrophota bacterium]
MTEFSFPKNFLWGAATSAHQVEGNNVHSDWWAWEQAGRVQERSGLACDHYRRYKEDFDLAVSLGHNAHRFSIEWARIEPAEGAWNDEALTHYVDVVRALRERHLEPIVTLHHFTTPQWLVEQGGWLNPKIVHCFARYVERVAAALGDSVRYWITINEPLVYIRMHFIDGLGPPGLKNLKDALQVTRHLIYAHAAGYYALHGAPSMRHAPPRVSIAQHLPEFWPCRRWWPMDHWITSLTDQIFNHAFVDALRDGRWTVPGVATWELPEARQTLDFLGVNFYGRQFIRWKPMPQGWPGSSCDLAHHYPREVKERTSLGWDVHPPSFTHALSRWGHLGLPILVTENGTYMTDDARRWSYIRRHIQAMAQAIRRGAPVIGYCCWSLLDNFEWAQGYGPRFGIVNVDYATQRRTVRESGHRYADVCRRNAIELNSA